MEADTSNACIRPGIPCAFLPGETYEQRWVLTTIFVSWMVSYIGAFTTLRISGLLRTCHDRFWYHFLVILAGLSLGVVAIWDMHHVGMTAQRLEATSIDGVTEEPYIEYSFTLMAVSGLVSGMAGSASIWIVTGRSVARRDEVDKEFFCRMGLSIAVLSLGTFAMQYLGMLARSAAWDIEWNEGLVCVSYFASVMVATLIMLIFVLAPPRTFCQLPAAACVATGVYGVHYAGIAAVTYKVSTEDFTLTGGDGFEMSNLVVVVLGLAVNTFITIPVQHYSEAQRVQSERTLHEHHAQMLQGHIDLSTQVCNALVDYNLEAAHLLLQGSEDQRLMRPLQLLMRNLTVYRSFLPHALFEKSSATAEVPNKLLAKEMQECRRSVDDLSQAIKRMRDPSYNVLDFHMHMTQAFPELNLYLLDDNDKLSSGHSGVEEYQRTLGAFYTLFGLFRLDIDGKEIVSFGVDNKGRPNKQPVEHNEVGAKKQKFYRSMEWDKVADLMVRAGMLSRDHHRELVTERVIAILALTAIHDIMKNSSILPRVQAEHAPYQGYAANEEISDHDVALAYVLEHYPSLLPSFQSLSPAQRAPVLFTQAKMNFNNGWLVQGEAPPGALFRTFKEAILQGRASESDVSFYFVHWLTDLAGAEPFGETAWPGAEKLTLKLPPHVLVAFLHSFKFVERLADKPEVHVMESYLQYRFHELSLTLPVSLKGARVAAMRLVLMAQGFEKQMLQAFASLKHIDRELLAVELARTGCKEEFHNAPRMLVNMQNSNSILVGGPALLVYYGPALIQKAGEEEAESALTILAAVFRAARELFPVGSSSVENTCIVRIDALKVMKPSDILRRQPWIIKRTGTQSSEVVRHNCEVTTRGASGGTGAKIGNETALIKLPL